MATTMDDIAKELGVSIATVSRALSNPDEKISDEVRRAIVELARKRGYQKRRRRGKTVAFVIDNELFNLSSSFYTSIISAIQAEIASRHYFFQFAAVERENLSLDRINLRLQDLAGVALVGASDPEFIAALESMMIPMVLVDYYIPTADIDTVLVDNVDGIIRAGQHLAELGHREVCYLSGNVDRISSHERRYGYLRAQEQFGFSTDPTLVEECAESISEGFEAMNRVFEATASVPTAVIAYNDMIAIGAMDAIKQRGYSIPEEISVIGFDDIPLASEVVPPLTTIEVPKVLMGTLAADILFQRIRGETSPTRKVLLPPRTIVRGSTARPRAH